MYSVLNKLIPIELSTILFPVKRVFFVSDYEGAIRGNHAHYKQTQYIVCLTGEVWVDLLSDELKCIRLTPGESCYVQPLVWDTVRFAKDSSILVFSDMSYDKDDYINDMKEFNVLSKI